MKDVEIHLHLNCIKMLKAFMNVLRIVEITFNAVKIRIECEKIYIP